jgi:hypothetical protein
MERLSNLNSSFLHALRAEEEATRHSTLRGLWQRFKLLTGTTQIEVRPSTDQTALNVLLSKHTVLFPTGEPRNSAPIPAALRRLQACRFFSDTDGTADTRKKILATVPFFLVLSSHVNIRQIVAK